MGSLYARELFCLSDDILKICISLPLLVTTLGKFNSWKIYFYPLDQRRLTLCMVINNSFYSLQVPTVFGDKWMVGFFLFFYYIWPCKASSPFVWIRKNQGLWYRRFCPDNFVFFKVGQRLKYRSQWPMFDTWHHLPKMSPYVRYDVPRYCSIVCTIGPDKICLYLKVKCQNIGHCIDIVTNFWYLTQLLPRLIDMTIYAWPLIFRHVTLDCDMVLYIWKYKFDVDNMC